MTRNDAVMLFEATVDRVCRVRQSDVSTPSTGPDGFRHDWLTPPSDVAVQEGLVATPAELASRGALILLGEPGMGKTTALESVCALVDNPIEVDGIELTEAGFEATLLGRLQPALKRAQATRGGDVLCVIDQVDESPELHRLGRRLRLALRGQDTRSLRLVLACRTADLPPDLIDVVEELCGEVCVADLLPLSRSEAEQLATSVTGADGRRVDGQALVTAAIEAGAGVLAATPLTLQLLVRQFLRDGGLTPNAAELFADGVDLLAQEWTANRERNSHLTVEERRAIAQQIAVRLVLTGRRTIWTGQVGLERREQDVRKDALLDPSPAMGSNQRLDEVLDTALFIGVGSDRLTFAHSSFAAYLAARYLVAANPPEPQLRSLFLVPNGDDRYGIPTPLRETAAWLVTLNRRHAAWLAEADAESLAAHRSALDSPEVRALIVEVLLRRAEEIELVGGWGYQYRSLGHPDLSEQLRPVLGMAPPADADGFVNIARMRIALRLCAAEQLPSLVPELLSITSERRWPSHIRAFAATVAADADRDGSAPTLRAVLAALPAESGEVGDLAHDELRTALLEALWPGHVPTLEVLTHFAGPSSSFASTSMFRFGRRLAQQLTEAELPEALHWMVSQLSRATASLTESEGERSEPEDRVGSLPSDLVYDLVDRAMSAPTWPTMLVEVAALCRANLGRKQPPLPAALAALDDDGSETQRARDARRELALALIRSEGPDAAIDAWDVVRGWSQIQQRGWRAGGDQVAGFSDRRVLLDADDFQWAYDLALAAPPEEQGATVELAASLLEYERTDTTDLLASDPTHPVYLHLRWLFEAVDLDSELASRGRRRHRRKQREGSFNEAEASDFVRLLHDRLDAAMSGDTNAFVELVHQLQYDPQTGVASPTGADPLVELPGVKALQRPEDLTAAAFAYLRTAEDDRAKWLGTNRVPWAWRAAELAFGHLRTAGRLDELDGSVWRSWVGVVVEYPHRSGFQSAEVERDLTERAVAFCEQDMADALAMYARRHVRAGTWASSVERVDVSGSDLLTQTYATLLAELTEALSAVPDGPLGSDAHRQIGSEPDLTQMVVEATENAVRNASQLWRDLYRRLFSARPGSCRSLALDLLTPEPAAVQIRLATLAGANLLLADPGSGWKAVAPLATTSPDVAVGIAYQSADHGQQIERTLTEEEVADLYRWLAVLVPPHSDPVRAGAYWVGPDDQARDWRDRILTRLAERGTGEALAALRRLSNEFPDRLVIRAAMVKARRQISELRWLPPESSAIAALLADPHTRLVETDEQLADLIVGAIDELRAELPQVWELLWDRAPGALFPDGVDRWVPKNEAAIGAFIGHELHARLRRGVAINREVLVVPTGPDGSYTRIDIKAQAKSTRTHRRDPVVMVELKGAWHVDVLRAQDRQLAQAYLLPTGVAAGVYVVVWFDPARWSGDVGDRRRTLGKSRNRTVPKLTATLKAQADDIGLRTGLTVRPVVLAVPSADSTA